MAINDDQRSTILNLLSQGILSNEQIGEKVGVSPGTVAAVRANVTMGRYKCGSPDSVAEAVENASEIAFSLERDMQKALRLNIQQLEAGLVISDGGKERNTEAGRIDITAKDLLGNTVIIELKAGIASPEALTQVMAYVGAVSQEEGKLPRAFLVAEDFHKKVMFAAKAIPGLHLRRYKFKFTFSSIAEENEPAA